MIKRKETLKQQQRRRLESLMCTAVDTNGAFKILPPQELRKGTFVVDTDDVITSLIPTIWQVIFRNGATSLVSFTELILFLFNFRQVNLQLQALDEAGVDETSAIKLITTTDATKVMNVAVIHELLGRLTAVRRGE